MSTYPPCNRAACDATAEGAWAGGARICSVEPESPFDDAGFIPGCVVRAVDGEPLRDIIDWRWLTGAEDEVSIAYVDTDGDSGEVLLARESGQPWGVEFDSLLFDGVKTCRNACTFCFMRQLPAGMRGALSVRDDDYRLSFLTGTFVTLTNVTAEDERRIVEQSLSPLRFSLHACDRDVRRRLIGAHEGHGMEVFCRLSDAGIRFDVQIVLVPGENDGRVLDETLAWAAAQTAIDTVGIVPLGYTSHQDVFVESYDAPDAAATVLAQVEAASLLRSEPWVYAADEFYLNAYGMNAIERIPPSAHYGDYALFEDGVGMVRTFIDEWRAAEHAGLVARTADAISAYPAHVHYVFGEAMRPVIEGLWTGSALDGLITPLFVPNGYFGGNVTVTGLLTARDIIRASRNLPKPSVLAVPRVIFNDNGITLDDQTAAQLAAASSCEVHVVSCNPMQFLDELRAIPDN